MTFGFRTAKAENRNNDLCSWILVHVTSTGWCRHYPIGSITALSLSAPENADIFSLLCMHGLVNVSFVNDVFLIGGCTVQLSTEHSVFSRSLFMYRIKNADYEYKNKYRCIFIIINDWMNWRRGVLRGTARSKKRGQPDRRIHSKTCLL